MLFHAYLHFSTLYMIWIPIDSNSNRVGLDFMRLKYETDRSIPCFNERNFFMSHKLKWNTLTIEVHRLFQWQRVDMWFGSNFCYAFLEIRLVDVKFALSYFIEHVVYRHNPYKIFLGQTIRDKQIRRLRGITLKLSPPIDVAIKDVVWKIGT